MNNKKIITIIVSVLVVAGGLAALVISLGPKEPKVDSLKYEAFAQCLRDKGATMYGAKWCSHCQEQKKEFGDSFKYINYIECPDNIDLCVKEGIQGYPTWKFASGTTVAGLQPLTELARISGCTLPQ